MNLYEDELNVKCELNIGASRRTVSKLFIDNILKSLNLKNNKPNKNITLLAIVLTKRHIFMAGSP